MRDADDIDRADAMRICVRAYHDAGECPAWESIEPCRKRIEEMENQKARICGTETAKRLWLENIIIKNGFSQIEPWITFVHRIHLRGKR